MIKISDVINDEQLLDFALSYVADKNSYDEAHPVAEQIIIIHIMNECNEKNCDEEYIQKRYRELITDHIPTGLASKGFVDVGFENGNIVYKINEDFKRKLNEHKDC